MHMSFVIENIDQAAAADGILVQVRMTAAIALTIASMACSLPFVAMNESLTKVLLLTRFNVLWMNSVQHQCGM